MIKLNESRPDRRLRGVAEELINGCQGYSRLVKGTGGPQAGRTKLDKERHKICLREIVSCKRIKVYYISCNSFLNKII